MRTNFSASGWVAPASSRCDEKLKPETQRHKEYRNLFCFVSDFVPSSLRGKFYLSSPELNHADF